jgi:hypothetical protein
MARSEAAVLVDARAEAIFPWLVEGERLRRWVSGLLVHEQLSPVRFRQVVQEGAARVEGELAVSLLAVPERLEATLTARGVETDMTYVLEPAAGGATRVRATVEVRFTSIVTRVAGPIVARRAQRRLEGDLHRLKRLVEAGDPGAAPGG